MLPEEFLREIEQIVARRSKASHLVDTLAFVNEVAERLGEDPVFGEFEPAEWEGAGAKGRPLKIHGYTRLDESDGSIGLVLGKWDDVEEGRVGTLNTPDTPPLFKMMENFVQESIENNLCERITEANPGYELAYQLDNDRKKINRIRLHLFTNLSLGSKFKEKVEGEIAGIPLERHIWDLQRISALYQSTREREAVEINLADFGENGIPCIQATDAGAHKSYLCVIKANLLADLFDRYGSRLLEGNVRSFLGMKGGVNKGIRKTIQDQPHLFFAYNNGIAATASEVEIDNVNGQPTITKIVDLQIVNGGQTTASILSSRKRDKLSLDSVSVQMKLTRVGQAEAQELVPKIAEFANTQNKVNVADFFANHPFHRKMEEISRRLLTPTKVGQRIQSKWFYERSRGQYQNERLYLTQSQKNAWDSEYPSSQVINKTDLAKYDSTWSEKPHLASLGAQKNFVRFAEKFEPKTDDLSQSEYWETISPQYGDSYFKNMVAVAIIWKTMEEVVDKARGDWYQGGYRINIVTYTIAKAVHLARANGLEIDLDFVWSRQAAGQELTSYLTMLAKEVQEVLLSPPPGERNIGEWCKKEFCWKQVIALEVSPIPEVGICISRDEHRLHLNEAKKQGTIDDGISLQREALNLCMSGYWAGLSRWNAARDHFTPMDISLLTRAGTVNGFVKITSEKDWKRLLLLKKTAEDEGFRHS